MNKKYVIAISLILLILGGTLGYIYLEDSSAHKIKFYVDIHNIDFKQISATNGNITVKLKVVVSNPTNFEFKVEKIFFKIYLEDEFIGFGRIDELSILPNINKTEEVDIQIPSQKIMTLLMTIIMGGGDSINYKIEILYDIPITFLGIYLYQVDRKDVQKGNYTISIPLPTS